MVHPARDRSITVTAEPDEATTLKIYVTLAGRDITENTQPFRFIVVDPVSGEQAIYKATFNGPSDKSLGSKSGDKK